MVDFAQMNNHTTEGVTDPRDPFYILSCYDYCNLCLTLSFFTAQPIKTRIDMQIPLTYLKPSPAGMASDLLRNYPNYRFSSLDEA